MSKRSANEVDTATQGPAAKALLESLYSAAELAPFAQIAGDAKRYFGCGTYAALRGDEREGT